MSLTAVLLTIGIAAPGFASLLALLPGVRRAIRHLGVIGAAFGLTAALALAILVGVSGQATTIRLGADDGLWFGVTADRLTVLLLLLVSFVNTVVQVFARRQLLGDDSAAQFVIRSGLLISATAAMVTSASVITLAAGWTASGLALIALVSMHWPQPAARDAARHTARMILIGDTALWVAVVLHLTHGGTQDISALSPAPDAGPVTGTVIAVLLVVAAAARCAQLPFHRWLSASLVAPTPVSAILHAGVVNAGGILLVRLYPLVGATWWATGVTFAVAAVGTVYATLIMLARPDIKGALVYSTIAQMAFLLLACSLGLLAAAISHLIAHGMFKSTLFLGSTSTVGSHVRHEDEPALAPLSRIRLVALGVLSITVAAASVAALAGVLRPESHASGAVLMAFAALTAASAGWGWIRRKPTGSGVAILLVAVPLMAGAYLTILTAITRFLDQDLAPMGVAAAPAWAFAALLVVLVAVWFAPSQARRFPRAAAWLYAHALAAGQPIRFQPRAMTAPHTMPYPHLHGVVPVPHVGRPLVAMPEPASEGVRL
ncbi:proton-conducting transporter membrane subunit [Microbacterium sp.]|uniref:proton-conducting transporter transmembrane domain-containing protein n=1 Tax=Microbacterium sp. TaxID=51671 RepID=UPI003A8C915E